MASALSVRLGKCIVKLRQKRGWHQIDLSVNAEITRSHLSHIEHGTREICLDRLEKIASALETTPADLLFLAQSLKK